MTPAPNCELRERGRDLAAGDRFEVLAIAHWVLTRARRVCTAWRSEALSGFKETRVLPGLR